MRIVEIDGNKLLAHILDLLIAYFVLGDTHVECLVGRLCTPRQKTVFIENNMKISTVPLFE
jgi:hypothetical protein